MRLARRTDAMQEGGYRELWELIEEGHVDPSHPRFSEVVRMAEGALKGMTSDTRKHVLAILDWAEDNAL